MAEMFTEEDDSTWWRSARLSGVQPAWPLTSDLCTASQGKHAASTSLIWTTQIHHQWQEETRPHAFIWRTEYMNKCERAATAGGGDGYKYRRRGDHRAQVRREEKKKKKSQLEEETTGISHQQRRKTEYLWIFLSDLCEFSSVNRTSRLSWF